MVASVNSLAEGKVSAFCSKVAPRLFRQCRAEGTRSLLRAWVLRLEGGPGYSLTIREILRRFYGLEVGLYTAAPCSVRPRLFHPGTTIGRYSSIAPTVRTFTRNHPMNTKSTHGLFYNTKLGKAKVDPVSRVNLVIGNGVSIGHNAIILTPTERIGDGAMIMAGSVVYGNIPPYAIASGFPARVTGYRFGKETIAELLASRWWEKPLASLTANGEDFPRQTGNPETQGQARQPEAN